MSKADEGDSRTRLSHLLEEASRDEPRWGEELLPLVYEQLRDLARARVAREDPGQTLQATALVHEAYMRLIGNEDPGWNGRGHFFGAAAQAMRRILVEQARRKGRVKRGGGRGRVDVDVVDVEAPVPEADVLAIEEALQRLELRDERKARLVELRYFAGLTAEETASVLEVSLGTVERDWRFVKAWLRTELG